MNPITHFLISWNTAALTGVARRDRILITLGGILPDIDSLGIVAELLTRNSRRPLNLFSEYHHQLTHNITTAVVGAIAVFLLTKRKLSTALIFFGVFHLHLLCDLIGARGPEGYQWPSNYLFPFSSAIQLTWQHQWLLNSWQNMAITLSMLGMVFILARKKSISPLEVFSNKANELFIRTIRKYKHE